MARVAKAVATTAPAKAVSKVDSELEALLGQSSELAGQQKLADGSATYIQIVNDPESNIVTQGSAEFIKGAKYKSLVIPSKKINLGLSTPVTIIGLFKVFEQVIFTDGADSIGKIVGYWHPDDVLGFPMSGYFDREFVDNKGQRNLLRQAYWMYLYLHEHEEVKDVRLTLRGAACSIAKKIDKMIGTDFGTLSQAVFELSTEVRIIEKYNKKVIDPKFTFSELLYELNSSGGVAKFGPSASVDILKSVLRDEVEVRKTYNEGKMVTRRDQKQLAMASGPAGNALSASSTVLDDDEVVVF